MSLRKYGFRIVGVEKKGAEGQSGKGTKRCEVSNDEFDTLGSQHTVPSEARNEYKNGDQMTDCEKPKLKKEQYTERLPH